MRDVFSWDSDRCACFWITPFAWWAMIQTEATETSYLRPIPLRQRLRHLIQDRTNGQLNVFERELRELVGKSLDKFRTGHDSVDWYSAGNAAENYRGEVI